MSTSTSAASKRTSRPSFIDGEFEVVRYAEFLAKEYPKALAAAIKESVKEETAALKDAARNSDTPWMGMVSKLKVNYNENSGMVEYGIPNDDESSRSATDLEYGVPNVNDPQPLLRSFVKQRESELGNIISDKVAQRLNGKYR